MRWFLFTESFGIRLTDEAIIAVVAGLIVGGRAAIFFYQRLGGRLEHYDRKAARTTLRLCDLNYGGLALPIHCLWFSSRTSDFHVSRPSP